MIAAASQQRLGQNWQAVQEDVAEAARQAGRSLDEVTIVGVSKYVDAETTAALFDAGCTILGENRPQAIWQKASYFAERDAQAPAPRWQLIGHLQRNKAKRTLPLLDRLQSIDSLRLLETVGELTATSGTPLTGLIEVNVSGEANKTGLEPAEAAPLLAASQRWPQLQIAGLMAMAGWGCEGGEARRQFAALRTLRDTLRRESGLDLPELSMGMSGDFAEAIAEGATLVRIGSRLFTGIPRP